MQFRMPKLNKSRAKRLVLILLGASPVAIFCSPMWAMGDRPLTSYLANEAIPAAVDALDAWQWGDRPLTRAVNQVVQGDNLYAWTVQGDIQWDQASPW